MYKVILLKWTKKSNGDLVSVHNETIYKITVDIIKGGDDLHFTLFIDGIEFFSNVSESIEGKDSCKLVAGRMASDEDIIRKETNRLGFITYDVFPKIDGPNFKEIKEAVKLSKDFGCINPVAGIYKVNPEYRKSLEMELWEYTIYGIPNRKDTENPERIKTNTLAEKEENENIHEGKEETKKDRERDSFTQNIESSQGLQRFTARSADYPKEIKLDNAKYSSIIQWVKGIREFYKQKGTFPTIVCLRGFLERRELPKEKDRRDKALGRFDFIYRQEFEMERAIVKELSRTVISTEVTVTGEVKTKGSKDKYGFRGSSKASLINKFLTTEFKTVKEIKTEPPTAKTVIASHLSRLVKMGLAIKKKFRSNKTGKVKIKYALVSNF